MIIVNETNRNRINSEFQKVEGRATARLCDYSNVVNAISRIEDRVIRELKANKKDLNGCTFMVYPFEGSLPRAYKYPAYGDCFKLTYLKNKWRLVEVYRSKVGSTVTKIEATYTDDFIKSVIKNNESF